MLNFGSFVKCIGRGLAESDQNIVMQLLKPLRDDDEFDWVDKADASRFIAGKRPIPQYFRDHANQDKYIQKVYNYFEKEIQLNKESKLIIIEEIKQLIVSDDSIPENIKEEWLSVSTDAPLFLTRVYLYTIGLSKPPKGSASKSPHALSAELNFAQDDILGREDELKKIAMLVNEGHKPIVIWGEGGIGKTELALKFCKGFDTSKCHFVRYHNSIKDTIAGLSFANTPETHKNLPVEKRFEKHIEWLKEYDDTHLLILDNLDDDNKTLAELLADHDLACICQLRFKLIITTRNKPQFLMSNAIHLESLPETELLKLIKRYYQRWEADGTTDDELIALIKALDGHTLCCELAAKTLQETSPKTKPNDIIAALRGDYIAKTLAIVDTEKDRCGYSGKITDHIKKLYTISSLTAEEIETMRYMMLTSPSGIDYSLLLDANFGIEQAPLQTLIKKGWLTKALDTDLITIHPVIRSFCLLTPELCPTLVEEKFLDFIDNIYAFAGHPANRSTYLRAKLHTPYEEWRKEEKVFYRQWKQVESMTGFLAESVEQLVPVPISLDQAKGYFNYVNTFLDLRKERNGPVIPWESIMNTTKRYLAMDGFGIQLGRKLAFRMRDLAFNFLEANLPQNDPFWGTAYDHMGRCYSGIKYSSIEEYNANQKVALAYFSRALLIYNKNIPQHLFNILSIFEWFSKSSSVSQERQLNCSLRAVSLIDEHGLAIPLECAKFCKRIAWIYKERAVQDSNTGYHWLLRADRRGFPVDIPTNTDLSSNQLTTLNAALQWLMREEQEYLTEYVDVLSAPSNVSMRASQKNQQLADLYERISYVHSALNNLEKELEYRIYSAHYSDGLIERRLIPSASIEKHFAICQCQRDLQLYSDCLITCRAIIESTDLNSSRKDDKETTMFIGVCAITMDCCCKLCNYDDAIAVWSRLEALGLEKHRSFPRFSLGIYTDMVDCYGAQANIEKQYEFEAKVLEAKKGRGLISNQDYIDTSTDLAKKLMRRKRFATAYNILLKVEMLYDTSLPQYKLQLNPDVYISLAQCLRKLGQTENAKVYMLTYAETTGRKLLAKFIRWNQKMIDE